MPILKDSPTKVLDGTETVFVYDETPGPNLFFVKSPIKTTAQAIADLGGGGPRIVSYHAKLFQSGINNPSIIVLYNDTGATAAIVRDDAPGLYILTFTGLSGEMLSCRRLVLASDSGNFVDVNPLHHVALGQATSNAFWMSTFREIAGVMNDADSWHVDIKIDFYLDSQIIP